MKKTRILPIVLVVLIMLFTTSVASASSSDERNFVANLRGEAERPNPIDSDATGVAVFHLNKEETELRYKVVVTNLENVTQAHIHCGSAEVAGPVVAFLFGFDPAGVTVNGVLAEGTITAANVIPRPSSAICPGGVANFEDLIAKMRSGDAYVNVHTIAFQPGEIRGQLK